MLYTGGVLLQLPDKFCGTSYAVYRGGMYPLIPNTDSDSQGVFSLYILLCYNMLPEKVVPFEGSVSKTTNW